MRSHTASSSTAAWSGAMSPGMRSSSSRSRRSSDGPSVERHERALLLRIPGDIDRDHAAVLEEAVWERMSFASHLRVRRLGEFTVGTDLLRSESLALVQVILLYHLVSLRAAQAVGGTHAPREPARATGADSALHA